MVHFIFIFYLALHRAGTVHNVVLSDLSRKRGDCIQDFFMRKKEVIGKDKEERSREKRNLPGLVEEIQGRQGL